MSGVIGDDAIGQYPIGGILSASAPASTNSFLAQSEITFTSTYSLSQKNLVLYSSSITFISKLLSPFLLKGVILPVRVWEIATVTGTGDVILSNNVTSTYFSFSSQLNSGQNIIYVIRDKTTNEIEVVSGTFINSTYGTLTRTKVLQSSNSGELVNFKGNQCDVLIDLSYPTNLFNLGTQTVYTNGSGYLDNSLLPPITTKVSDLVTPTGNSFATALQLNNAQVFILSGTATGGVILPDVYSAEYSLYNTSSFTFTVYAPNGNLINTIPAGSNMKVFLYNATTYPNTVST
jgi:hypothetical protein